jgi:hypothetical protein
MKQVEKIWAELSAKAQEVETPQEVELSEEQKVELGLGDNLAKYAKGVSKYTNEGDGLMKRAERLMSELKETKSALYKWAEVGNSIADDIARDSVQFEKAAKDLGVDPNSNSDFKSADNAFNVYAKSAQKYERYAKEI